MDDARKLTAAEKILWEHRCCTISEDADLDDPKSWYFSFDEALKAMKSYASQQMPSDINDILLEDCKQMRKAGNDLAIAAMRVVGQYDGIHRLSAAVSYWNNVISTEGGRLKSLQQENQTED